MYNVPKPRVRIEFVFVFHFIELFLIPEAIINCSTTEQFVLVIIFPEKFQCLTAILNAINFGISFTALRGLSSVGSLLYVLSS